MMRENLLGTYLEPYFSNYLTLERNTSRHTLLSYRDSFKLLLGYMTAQTKRKPSDMEVRDFTRESILAFLTHLEQDRNCQIGTRNSRLAAIKSFFSYIAMQSPAHLATCQEILSISYKRASKKPIECFSVNEMHILFDSIDCNGKGGRRNHFLLRLLYATGMRAQEVCDLRVKDCRLERPYLLQIIGKGQKIRACPLHKDVAEKLAEYIADEKLMPDQPVIQNRYGEKLSRFGVYHLLKKIHEKSKLARLNMHPHRIRHTTAVHLVDAEVDLNTIRSWYGHVNMDTTNNYAQVSLKKKREALEKCGPIQNGGSNQAIWKDKTDILQYLVSL